MAEHEHGTMDITTHQKTFDSFIKLVSRGAVMVVLILILLALVSF